ncbi:methyltransferase domain-containing protein [Shewanella sp. C32]|uniref:Methyltransferase domain-containing protein n=1 Tax=Shewanella electrica TaxID=515560 RepID=A0ABT2FIB2_9GAMM|nr:methyltransferase domain-containing protein [Shewanella electrica]MCH1924143.1 methyltransferase domain-containing protein [Shewanella electrica]MCS4556046.1 methyltransferase domain-containing protein [Shewanella electrica]
MQGLVNWRLLRERMMAPLSQGKLASFDWNQITDMYDGMAQLERRYTQMQVDVLPITADDTVVDIGCGPGRLSVPMAQKAHSVTCVDAFDNMLSRCMHNGAAAGLNNLRPLLQDWNSDDAVAQIGMHDIAVASRSVGFADLIKLNSIARKYAVVMSFANAPSLREIQLSFLDGIIDMPAMPHSDDRNFGYNITFNMLYDMGAEPNIRILDDGYEAQFASREAAYEALRFVGDIPANKEAQYRANVDKYLSENADGFRLFRASRTFVMWWKTCELQTLS